MIYYLDTCVILSAVQADGYSENVDAWLKTRRTSELVTSTWTFTEAVSALGRLVRMKDLSSDEAFAKYQDIETWLTDEFQVEAVLTADFSVAAERQTHWSLGLRAGDAIHLAVATRIGATVVTTDHALERACAHYNVAVQSPN
jgi:uncharacterized protein